MSLQPIGEDTIQKLANSLTPGDQANEGNSTLYTFTALHGSVPVNVFQVANPYRKRLTIINSGTVTVYFNQINKNGITIKIPIPANFGSLFFDTIIRGKVEQCLNGYTIVQDLTNCEYMGRVTLENDDGATDAVMLLVETV